MNAHTDLQQRILDAVNRYAPPLDVVQMNERATVAWEECAQHDPACVEAAGLEDIKAVRRKIRYLYWYNTLAQLGSTSGKSPQHPLSPVTDLTIVVVDDDPDILDFMDLFLTSEGNTVTTSDYTGDVAALIRQVLPHVVLLDLQTPQDRQAGLGVLSQLRADPVTMLLPVLLVTADQGALHQHAADLREVGAIPLLKPFELDHLEQMINQAVV